MESGEVVPRDSSVRIEEIAAGWLARRDLGLLSDERQEELDRWLKASTAHRVAYLRLEAAWRSAGRFKALAAGLPHEAMPAPGALSDSPFFAPRSQLWRTAHTPDTGEAVRDELWEDVGASRHAAEVTRVDRRRVLGAIAASLAGAAGVYALWNHSRGGTTYTTAVGGLESVPMADGSTVTLNTDTALRVRLFTDERLIELERGEAFFEVAKDASRPFIVRAGDQSVTAVGTKFAVWRSGTDLRVVVAEGRVRIDGVRGSVGAWVYVPAGSIARVTDSSVQVEEAPAAVEAFLSWRTGFVEFGNVTLAQAVAEMNRYSPRKIVIDDAAIGALRIGGRFRAKDTDGFIRILRTGFDIGAHTEGETIRLRALAVHPQVPRS
jgi:transmembrane sensor